MELLEKIAMVLIIITFVLLIISNVFEIVRSNAFYKKMKAELELYKGTLKRENDLRHALIEFGDWLMGEFEKTKKEMDKKPSEYNDGKLTATQDIVGTFLNTVEDCLGAWDDNGKESSD